MAFQTNTKAATTATAETKAESSLSTVKMLLAQRNRSPRQADYLINWPPFSVEGMSQDQIKKAIQSFIKTNSPKAAVTPSQPSANSVDESGYLADDESKSFRP